MPRSGPHQVTGLRFSPDGRQIAFTEFEASDNYALGVVDLSGKARILSAAWEIIDSVAWHPGTGEIWFSGRKRGVGIGVVELHAITLSGKERLVAQTPQLLIVEDIAQDGRVLARSDDWPETMMCLPPGATREVNLTWLDFSQGVALSADGQDLLFIEGGAGAGATGGVYMRKTDGSTAAVRLGDGWSDRQDLSPDKKWIVQAQPDRLTLVPVGPGEPKTIQDKDFQYRRALWFPDGKRLLVAAATPGHGLRMYVRDLEQGPPRPMTPEGTGAARLSRDGTRVVVGDLKTLKWTMYPVDEGSPHRPRRRSRRRGSARVRRQGPESLRGVAGSLEEDRSAGSRDRQTDLLQGSHAGRSDGRRLDRVDPADAGRQELLLQLHARVVAPLRGRRAALVVATRDVPPVRTRGSTRFRISRAPESLRSGSGLPSEARGAGWAELAEEEGFEPPVPFPVQRFSRPPP